jgi:hypothetical protein
MIQRVRDPIRNRLVAATPEEIVRQHLLHMMLHELGYPKGLIAVEKEIGAHRRRADIVCYARDLHPQHALFPLLIVECKAHDGTDAAREQALGYNAAMQAPFLCVASQKEIHTLWLQQGKIASVPFLPAHRDLLEMAKRYAKH